MFGWLKKRKRAEARDASDSEFLESFRKVREYTNAGAGACRAALAENGGDVAKAIAQLIDPADFTREAGWMRTRTMAPVLEGTMSLQDAELMHEVGARIGSHDAFTFSTYAEELKAFSIPPQTEFADYLIDCSLGKGGMGEVFRATSGVAPYQKRAIKILPPRFRQHEEAVKRFEREADTLIRLRHPNIVRAYDQGVFDGMHWISMELVTVPQEHHPWGVVRTLEDVVIAHSESRDAVFHSIMSQLLNGLAQAHRRGVVHRDIKPSNVLMTRSQEDETIAKISDFGLAHVMHMHDVPTSGDAVIQQGGTLTQLGTVMGTPGFMSPEQLQGRVIDARSDLYSLGITAHVLLFHAFPDPEGIPHLSVGDDLWLPWVERLLRTDPDQRFSSAEDAKAALDEVVGVRLPPD